MRSGSGTGFKGYVAAAARLKLPLQFLELRLPNPDFQGIFRAARDESRQGALVTVSNIRITVYRKTIAELAIKHQFPAMYESGQMDEAGGLMSYGASDDESFERAAIYIDKILKGAKPAEPSRRAVDQVRVDIQLKNSQTDRLDDSSQCPGAGGQGHSVKRFWILDFGCSVRGCLFLCALLSALCLPVEAQPQKIPAHRIPGSVRCQPFPFHAGLARPWIHRGKKHIVRMAKQSGTDRS